MPEMFRKVLFSKDVLAASLLNMHSQIWLKVSLSFVYLNVFYTAHQRNMAISARMHIIN